MVARAAREAVGRAGGGGSLSLQLFDRVNALLAVLYELAEEEGKGAQAHLGAGRQRREMRQEHAGRAAGVSADGTALRGASRCTHLIAGALAAQHGDGRRPTRVFYCPTCAHTYIFRVKTYQ